MSCCLHLMPDSRMKNSFESWARLQSSKIELRELNLKYPGQEAFYDLWPRNGELTFTIDGIP